MRIPKKFQQTLEINFNLMEHSTKCDYSSLIRMNKDDVENYYTQINNALVDDPKDYYLILAKKRLDFITNPFVCKDASKFDLYKWNECCQDIKLNAVRMYYNARAGIEYQINISPYFVTFEPYQP